MQSAGGTCPVHHIHIYVPWPRGVVPARSYQGRARIQRCFNSCNQFAALSVVAVMLAEPATYALPARHAYSPHPTRHVPAIFSVAAAC